MCWWWLKLLKIIAVKDVWRFHFLSLQCVSEFCLLNWGRFVKVWFGYEYSDSWEKILTKTTFKSIQEDFTWFCSSLGRGRVRGWKDWNREYKKMNKDHDKWVIGVDWLIDWKEIDWWIERRLIDRLKGDWLMDWRVT